MVEPVDDRYRTVRRRNHSPEPPESTNKNFHEGMYDLYDERGNLLRQIDMGSGIKWGSYRRCG